MADAENASAIPPGKKRKPMGKIYEDIAGQMAGEYMERNRPQNAADVPESARRSITAEIFSNRLHGLLDRTISQGTFGPQIERVLAHPESRRRIAQLTREVVLEDKPAMRLLEPPRAG